MQLLPLSVAPAGHKYETVADIDIVFSQLAPFNMYPVGQLYPLKTAGVETCTVGVPLRQTVNPEICLQGVASTQ